MSVSNNMNRAIRKTVLPDSIFGLSQANHRVYVLKLFIRDRRPLQPLPRLKEHLLPILYEIGGEVAKSEGEAIEKWFRSARFSSTDASRFQQLQITKNQISAMPVSLLPYRQLTQRNTASSTNFKERTKSVRRETKEKKRAERREKIIFEIKELATNDRECAFCTEILSGEQFPPQPLAGTCNHTTNVCKTCIATCINTQIPDKQWDQVQCPECPSTLSFETVQSYASPEAFQIYDNKTLASVTGAMQNFAMCLNPRCSSGQIHEGGDNEPIMTCKVCNFKTCYSHKASWHKNQTCAEFDLAVARQELRAQERASEKWIEERAKMCPNSTCGVPIQKNGGCEHMTCKHCKHEFCWLCQADFDLIRKEGNSAHKTTCRFHRPNPRPARIVNNEIPNQINWSTFDILEPRNRREFAMATPASRAATYLATTSSPMRAAPRIIPYRQVPERHSNGGRTDWDRLFN